MQKEGHGISWESSLSGIVVSLVCFAFVDDTDLAISPAGASTGEDLITPAQRALDDWAGALGATGGELSPEKTFCYVLDYKLDEKEAKFVYRTKDDMPGEFNILDNDGIRHPIQRFEPSEGKETLGVCLAMDGNEEAQYDHLMAKAELFASQIRGADVDHNTAFYTLQNSFMKTIEYCLPAVNL